MPMSMDDLAKQEPYIGERLDASIHASDLLTWELTGEQIDAMDEDELQPYAEDWASSADATEDLLDINWTIDDPRFMHATSVTEFDITEVEFQYLETWEKNTKYIVVSVDVAERPEGFQERLKAEAAAREAS